MKSIHALLEEIKVKDPELFAKIEKEVQEHAVKANIQVDDTPTEHPHKPPTQP